MGDEATLGELRGRIAAFVAAREWEAFHNPKDLALALSVEASELLELFRWRGQEEVRARLLELKERIAGELADVFIFGLSMANAVSIDLTQAILRKMEENEERFPVEEYRGRAYGDSRTPSSAGKAA
ncbi:MAG: nucleotide pyrophosphohydrolase [Thermoplasmata archaeon]